MGTSNVGGGFVWSPGAVQWHMLAENLVLDVFNIKNVALHFGLSLNLQERDDVIIVYLKKTSQRRFFMV